MNVLLFILLRLKNRLQTKKQISIRCIYVKFYHLQIRISRNGGFPKIQLNLHYGRKDTREN
jgi:hypothetical protein